MCARQCWRRGGVGGLCSIFLRILVGKIKQPKSSKLLKIPAAKGWPSGSWLCQCHPTSLSFVPAGCTGVPWCSWGDRRAGTFFLSPVASELPDSPLQRLLWLGGNGRVRKPQGKAGRGKGWREWMRQLEQRQGSQVFPVIQWCCVFAI